MNAASTPEPLHLAEDAVGIALDARDRCYTLAGLLEAIKAIADPDSRISQLAETGRMLAWLGADYYDGDVVRLNRVIDGTNTPPAAPSGPFVPVVVDNA